MTTIEQPDIAWDHIKKRFRAYLTLHGEHQFLGYFQTPEDAAMARKQSAHMHVDSFAHDVSARPVFEDEPGLANPPGVCNNSVTGAHPAHSPLRT